MTDEKPPTPADTYPGACLDCGQPATAHDVQVKQCLPCGGKRLGVKQPPTPADEMPSITVSGEACRPMLEGPSVLTPMTLSDLSACLAALPEDQRKVVLEPYLDAAWRNIPPHDRVLFCPACGKQHLDIGEFATRVHRKHLCENTPDGPGTGCGHLWVPFPYATRGVDDPPYDDVLRQSLEWDDARKSAEKRAELAEAKLAEAERQRDEALAKVAKLEADVNGMDQRLALLEPFR